MVELLSEEKKRKTYRLYQEVFQDPVAYADLYYHSFIQDSKVYAIFQDGRYVSMIHLRERKLSYQGKNFLAYYLYSVATEKKYRRKGYAGSILKTIIEEARKNDIPLILLTEIPEFYKVYGFESLGIMPEPVLFQEDFYKSLGLNLVKAQRKDFPKMGEFLKKEKSQVVCQEYREEYFCNYAKVLACEDGTYYLVYDQNQLVGIIATIFCPNHSVKEEWFIEAWDKARVLNKDYGNHLMILRTNLLKQDDLNTIPWDLPEEI